MARTGKGQSKADCVYISYAWGGKSEEVATQVEQVLKKRGLEVVRDKSGGLDYKGQIDGFMQQIGKGHYVIAVVSDKYLRSKNCMYELLKLAENPDFRDRVFPIVLGDAQIYEATDILDYIGFWDDKKAALEDKLKGGKSLHNLQAVHRELDLFADIRRSFDNLSGTLASMNTLRWTDHIESNFEELYLSIEAKRKKDNFSVAQNSLATKSAYLHDERFEYDVFISFSSKNQHAVNEIAAELKAYNLRVFVSSENLRNHVGESFTNKIAAALANSHHFLLVSTPEASDSFWVEKECEIFYNKFHTRQPKERYFMVLEGSGFDESLLPLFYSSSQRAKTALQIVERLNEGAPKRVDSTKTGAETPRKPKEQRPPTPVPSNHDPKPTKGHSQKHEQQQPIKAADKATVGQATTATAPSGPRPPKQPPAAWFKSPSGKAAIGIPVIILAVYLLYTIIGGQENTAKTDPTAEQQPKTEQTEKAGVTEVQPIETPSKPKFKLGLPSKFENSIYNRLSLTDISEPIRDSLGIAEIEMVKVYGSTFEMGRNDGNDDEKPIVKVSVDDFCIGKFEVTNALWQAVMGSLHMGNRSDCLNCPVENVSFLDAQRFIRMLEQKTGVQYRLPTEAEWEFAAREGRADNGKFLYSGSNNLGEVSNGKKARNRSMPVGSKKQNKLTLDDMTGNVSEWCNTLYHPYGKEKLAIPFSEVGKAEYVIRGGRYTDFVISSTEGSKADPFRNGYRRHAKADSRQRGLGFRLARDPR